MALSEALTCQKFVRADSGMKKNSLAGDEDKRSTKRINAGLEADMSTARWEEWKTT